MALLDLSFLLLVFRPFLRKGFVARLAFEQAEATVDGPPGHGFEQDPFGRGLDHGLGTLLDAKLFTKPAWDHNLSLGGEPDGISLHCSTHKKNSTLNKK